MKNTKNAFLVIFVGLVIAGLLLIPLGIIWSLNTLFGLQIEYNFWTWLAVVVLNLTWLHKPVTQNVKLVK